jgi:hypothetical protein
MKKTILSILLLISITLNAEEFTYKGIVVKSEIISKTIKCNSLDIKLETEQFPFKYEGRIPYKFKINNYYGADNILRKEIFLMPEKLKIPFPKKLKKSVMQNRTFLPYKALCKNQKLVIFYTSGGNCKGCEAFIEFDIIDNQVRNPNLINYAKVRNFYE